MLKHAAAALLAVLAAQAQVATTTAAGVTFTAPDGWSSSQTASAILLQPPEQDATAAVIDVRGESASAAVDAAWAAYKPAHARKILFSDPAPGRNGWELRHTFTFETSPNERLVVQAIAMKAGDAWTVVILEGNQGTFEKRAAGFALITQSLRSKGFQRESFTGRKAGAMNAERIAQMREFVEKSMKVLDIPGAAIAFVDGGKVVYEAGLGVRELGKPEPATVNTLFMAASNTKGMTTLLLSKLVDEKKLRWDQPVTSVYPKFKLGDDQITQQVLIKHLVCACTGLPRQDLEWIFEFAKATPAATFDLLATMKPTSSFGEAYQYSNLMASAAGYVAAYIENPRREFGAGYDDAMRRRIFVPLGMDSTTFDMKLAQTRDHARPHSFGPDQKTVPIGMEHNYAVVPHRPAGGVWTSAHDLIRYVQLELNRGKLPNGKVLVSETNLLARRTPQVSTGEDSFYGMGLQTRKMVGINIVHHGGSLMGYKSDLMFLPDHGIGAVLLTNSDRGGMLLRPFMRRLLEVVFDGKPEALEDVTTQAANAKARLDTFRKRLVLPAAAEDAAKLGRRYSSYELGDLVVRRDGASVKFDAGEWSGEVATRRNDDGTTSFIMVEPGMYGLEFVPAERGGKQVLLVRDAQHEYIFTRSE